MASVTLKRLTKRFKTTLAVDNVTLDVQDKEFLVLVGPSGCGKTTVLRIIAGLEEPTTGEVYIGDVMVNDVYPADRDIAMVFQNYALYPHMTVYDNMAFGLRMRRVPRDNIRVRVRGAADMLGLGDLLPRKPKQLSGGERQRVALGRAIVREPKVFLMDEPLSNLDAKLRLQTRAELIKLHRRLGITTIYVTHDQVEGMTMGDRIAVLRDGRLQQVDTPLAVYAHPSNAFVAGFIGSPSMNFVPGKVRLHDGVCMVQCSGFTLRVPDARSDGLLPYEDRQVIFGIRPQDLYDKRFTTLHADEGNSAELKIDVVEPMGAESLVYLEAGSDTLVACLDAAAQTYSEGRLQVVFDMDRCHVFDPETEMAVF